MSIADMQAAVVAAPGTVRITRRTLPQPGESEVRVRLEGCGVCGSNLAPWEGRPWFKYPLAPGELGHEGWGHIDAIGARVEALKEGDRVALLSFHAYAEYDLAPESAVVRLPKELDHQAFPGEALGCAMNVFARADIRAGQSVAVVGVGFLGAVLVALSAAAGAKVFALSRRPFALKVAEKMGAREAIPLEDLPSAGERIKTLTGGAGCERVIEAAGQQATLDLASELTGERGRLVIAGYHQDGLRQVNLQLWNWRGLDVINAHEREPKMYTQGMRAAVQAVLEKRFDPSQLYTHRFALTELGTALNAMKERPPDFLKALITL